MGFESKHSITVEILAEAAGEVRAIEKNADQILSIIRYLENAETASEIRDAAGTLNSAINYLQGIAQDLDDIARRAEEAEREEEEADETCPHCDSPLDECTCHEEEKYCSVCNCRMPLDCAEHDDTGICEDCVG